MGAHCFLVIARVFDALQLDGTTTSTVTDRHALPALRAGSSCLAIHPFPGPRSSRCPRRWLPRRWGFSPPHSPGLGALLQILPGELPRLFGIELVIERLGIVVVDQDERLARLQ